MDVLRSPDYQIAKHRQIEGSALFLAESSGEDLLCSYLRGTTIYYIHGNSLLIK